MTMLFADFSVSLDPAYPWSLPTWGVPAMLGAATLLAALTMWTYRGVPQANWRRVTIVITLRLCALLLAFCLLLRPSLAVTHLEGVALSKLLVLFDASESMNAAEVEGQPTRWQELNKVWSSREVQRRLEQLATEQKIEAVRYLGGEDLQPFDPEAGAKGRRTDIGMWLHQLWQKHGHEKHVRGIVLCSDGADNGTKFPAQAKAQQWRGVAPIHAFGLGDPQNTRFRKDIGLTSLRVADDKPVAVKSKFAMRAVAQAPGFERASVHVVVIMKDLASGKEQTVAEEVKFLITQERDQPIEFRPESPELPGEYLLTLRIKPRADEANQENNEISTFVQVVKEKLNVLWVDRLRVYEPTLAIRLALAPEERFAVHHVLVPTALKIEPLRFYEFDQRHYDVIVIGDITAQQFCLGNPALFDSVKKLVTEKKTGLLMLGGTETFSRGGWNGHAALMQLLPARFTDKTGFSEVPVQALPVKDLAFPFLQLLPDPKKNDDLWRNHFDMLDGFTPLGELIAGSTRLLEDKKGQPLLVATQAGTGRTALFAADSTWRAWCGTPEALAGYQHFWKHLVLWLAWQQDQQDRLWIKPDKRRINIDLAESLGFSFGLRGKAGNELTKAQFKAKVVHEKKELPVRLGANNRGAFEFARDLGEHQLIIEAAAKDADGMDVRAEAAVRFLVVSEDLEKLRPLPEHEILARLAEASEGRFQRFDEQTLLKYLDELAGQITSESRHKTTLWPDWKRLPTSESLRDQLPGVWHSFSLVALLLFVTLLGCEWFLRRYWGMI